MMVSTEPTVKQRARSQQQFLLTHSRKTSRCVEMCKLRASKATGSSVRQLRDVSVVTKMTSVTAGRDDRGMISTSFLRKRAKV